MRLDYVEVCGKYYDSFIEVNILVIKVQVLFFYDKCQINIVIVIGGLFPL